MRNMVKKKMSEADWRRTWDESIVNIGRADINELVLRKVSDLRKKCSGGNVYYCWSGGKDSVVLDFLMREAGFKNCLLAISNLEYPAFMKWVMQNHPAGLKIYNTGQDLKWLGEHPEMLFPVDANGLGKWYSIVQHRAYEQFAKKNNVDMYVLGRRIWDGNYVAKNQGFVYHKKGVDYYAGIAELTHEEIFAIIRYYELKLPPVYDWKNGFTVGTGPWPSRQRNGSVENTWSEVFEIDKSVVFEASEYLPTAEMFLKSIGEM